MRISWSPTHQVSWDVLIALEGSVLVESLRKLKQRIVSSWELETIWNSSNCSRKTRPVCSVNVRIHSDDCERGSRAATRSHTLIFPRTNRRWCSAKKLHAASHRHTPPKRSVSSRNEYSAQVRRDLRVFADRHRTRCPRFEWCCPTSHWRRSCLDIANKRCHVYGPAGCGRIHRWSYPRWTRAWVSRPARESSTYPDFDGSISAGTDDVLLVEIDDIHRGPMTDENASNGDVHRRVHLPDSNGTVFRTGDHDAVGET